MAISENRIRIQYMTMSLRLLAGLLAISVTSTSADATDFHLYLLLGQSNMEGFGLIDKLPPTLAQPQNEVLIFHGNAAADGSPAGGNGIWATLRPGHGHRFRSDGTSNKYSDRFGMELTFAQTIAGRFPDRRIAILKYANGGTSIDPAAAKKFGCWDPSFEPTNQFDHFLKALHPASADKDIDGDGEPDKLIPTGIAWMQGESDANHTPEIADRYQANLSHLLGEVRRTLGKDDLDVAIGRVSPSQLPEHFWKHLDRIRAAQTHFAREDENTVLITSSDGYGFSDFWHFNAAGYIDLGKAFGNGLADLELRETKLDDRLLD